MDYPVEALMSYRSTVVAHSTKTGTQETIHRVVELISSRAPCTAGFSSMQGRLSVLYHLRYLQLPRREDSFADPLWQLRCDN